MKLGSLLICAILVGCQGNQSIDFAIIVPDREEINSDTVQNIEEAFYDGEYAINEAIGEEIGISFNLREIRVESYNTEIQMGDDSETEKRLDKIARRNKGTIEIFVITNIHNCPVDTDFVCGAITRHGGTKCGWNGYECPQFCDRWIAMVDHVPNQKNTFLHEMGHLGGLDHDSDQQNVMNKSTPYEDMNFEDNQYEQMNKVFEKMDWRCELQ